MFLRRAFKAALFLGLLAAPFAAQAQTQVQNNATVRGTVADPDGAVIPGAAITLAPASGAALHARAGADGTYAVRNVPAGTYTLTVTMPNFATFTQEGLRVAVGQSLTSDVKMTIADITTTMEVRANTNTVSVDPDNNASMTVLTGADLDALSDDPDELAAELEALAGPAMGPNGGQIYIDGFTGGTLPPKSQIREIRINQNPYSAEYDRNGSARIEVFTKPGTDKFHGSVSMQGNSSYFNTGDPLLDENAATGAPLANPPVQLPYHTLFETGSLSGPLTKKSSFTINGSHRSISDNAIINANILAPTATSTTLCAPGQAGCVEASYNFAAPTAQSRYDLSPRVDLALGPKNTLTTRLQFNTNSATSAGGNTSLPTLGSTSTSSEQTVALVDTQTINSRMVNETRFEYQRDHSGSTPLNTTPQINVPGIFSAGGSGGGTSANRTTHLEMQNYTSIALPKNFIRFGGRWRYNSEAIHDPNSNGSFTYAALTTENGGTTPCSATLLPSVYQCGTVSQYTVGVYPFTTLRASVSDVGLYAETDWKVKPTLTISYGLRFETQNQINDKHDFAPRANIAYLLSKKTQVHAGAGVFYDRWSLGQVFSVANGNGTNELISTVQNPGPGCTPSTPSGCVTTPQEKSNSTTTASPTIRTPYAFQFSGGIDQSISTAGRISIEYRSAKGIHQFFNENVDAPLPGVAPVTGASVNNQTISEGIYKQRQLFVSYSFRQKWYSLNGYSVMNWADADTSSPVVAYNIASNYGRAGFDVRNQESLLGSFTLPYRISLSPQIQFRTGSPYNVTTGTDLNGDTQYNDRPRFATSADPASVVQTIAGCGSFVSPTEAQYQQAGSSYAPIPVNYCTGPKQFTTSIRVSKTFGFGPSVAPRPARGGGDAGGGGGGGAPRGGGAPGGGGGGAPGGGGGGARGGGGGGGGRGGGGGNTGKRYNLNLSAFTTNPFNTVNLANPNGALTSPSFGRSTQLSGGSSSSLMRTTLSATFTF